MAPTEGSDVNITSVADFGVSAMNQMTTFMSGAGGPLGKASSAQVGLAGTPEGATFGARYGSKLQEYALLLNDVNMGLQSLGYGAIVIANNYRTSDLSQKRALDAVNSAFAPPPGTPSAASDVAAAQQEQDGEGDGTTRLPGATNDDEPNVCVLTPDQEARNFADLHDNADWRPPPPPTYLAPGPFPSGVDSSGGSGPPVPEATA